MTVIVSGEFKQGRLELLETPQGLPEGRVRVFLISEADPKALAHPLVFGKYDQGRPSTEEDFQAAEWHGDPSFEEPHGR